MNDIEIPLSHPRAAIYAHDKFILVQTYSGFRSGWADPEGEEIYLPADASDQALGSALIVALNASRVFTLENRPILTREQLGEWYEAWVIDVMQRYGFKSRRALFKPMKRVGVDQYNQQLHLRPSRHEKLEGWAGIDKEGSFNVILPYPTDVEVIGEAVRLALSRCL